MKETVGKVFEKLSLEGEALSGLYLEDCLFQGCSFTEVTLENCGFSGCQFRGCRVSAPKLQNVAMLSCDFQNCSLSGVDWSALLEERKRDMGFLPFDRLEGCSLRHCLFFGLDLKKACFSGMDLSYSAFEGCDLKEADFSRCRRQGASFSQNDMSQADFRGATDYLFSLEGNRVKGARFTMPEAANLLLALGVAVEGL